MSIRDKYGNAIVKPSVDATEVADTLESLFRLRGTDWGLTNVLRDVGEDITSELADITKALNNVADAVRGLYPTPPMQNATENDSTPFDDYLG